MDVARRRKTYQPRRQKHPNMYPRLHVQYGAEHSLANWGFQMYQMKREGCQRRYRKETPYLRRSAYEKREGYNFQLGQNVQPTKNTELTAAHVS